MEEKRNDCAKENGVNEYKKPPMKPLEIVPPTKPSHVLEGLTSL